MSEFMGMICVSANPRGEGEGCKYQSEQSNNNQGQYDAKIGGGFEPGGASLHNVMSAHGPDAQTHEKASNAPLKPTKVGEGSMAFMFESCLLLGVTEWGLRECRKVQPGYNEESWSPLQTRFEEPL
jgi:homogentisate 1,2-dioxygenase